MGCPQADILNVRDGSEAAGSPILPNVRKLATCQRQLLRVAEERRDRCDPPLVRRLDRTNLFP